MALTVRPNGHASVDKLPDLVRTHEKLTSKRLGVDWHFGLLVKLSQEPWLILDRTVEERADDRHDGHGAPLAARGWFQVDDDGINVSRTTLQGKPRNTRSLEHTGNVIPPGQSQLR